MPSFVMASYDELLAAARGVVREVDAPEAHELMGGATSFIDVREEFETDLGIIEGSRIIRLAELRERIGSEVPEVTTPIVLYCAHGNRSAVAALFLLSMGYLDVCSLAGGTEAWQAAGFDLTAPDQ